MSAMVLTGCGDDSGPVLAEAGGTVTYNGGPVSKANVVFMPDAGGPAAYGMTDDSGRFAFTTGGQPGAMVGAGRIAVTAYSDLAEPKTEEEMTAEDLQKMNESRIPVKYGNPDTSGLTAIVAVEGNNDFPLALTD
jgi:hypothetical protein